VHASLLPKYRGAAPIQWAIARGETITGVTTMHMNERMDAGDIIHQETVSIESDDTAASLQEKLGAVGAALLRRTIADIRSGTAPRTPQDDAAATLAPKLRKSDGRIAWHMAASEICCRVRGFNPWPGSACEVPAGSGRLLRVLKAREEAGVGQPGEIIAVEDGPLVGAARNAVRLLEVQPEGRKPMSGAAFLRGHPLTPGTRLG
jgi:methionyl-tRNA formyltransferase